MKYKRSFLFFSFILSFVQIAWSQLRIMPLGDSITQGVINLAIENTMTGNYISKQTLLTHEDSLQGLRLDGTRGILGDGNGGYRLVLEQMLKNTGWDLEMVGQRHVGGGNHEGHPGWMSSDLVASLPQILTQNNPDVVLLHIGTNDLPWPINADSCYKNTLRIVNRIHDFNPNVVILVAQIIPCLQNTSWGQQRYPAIISLNNKLQQITNGRPYIKLIDMWSAFTSTSNWESQLMCDTWHPNTQGYRVMAEEWCDGLLERISGRAPLLTSITPDSGEVTISDFHCTVKGNYFMENMQLILNHEAINPIEAYQIQFQSTTQIQAYFDLTTGSVGQWQVEAVNPNKMRSVQTPDIHFEIISPSVFAISGQVLNQENKPLNGVSVFLSFNSEQHKQKTNADGFYEFQNLVAGRDYQVFVYRSGFRFEPAKQYINNLQQDQTDVNFIGRNILLSGYVRKKNGKPISNVTIQLSGLNSQSVLTNSNGFYELIMAMPGEFTITPQKDNWTFIPLTQTVIVDTTDLEVSFTGVYQPPLYTISGQILDKETDTGIGMMTVRLTGAKSREILTNLDGFYVFDSLTASLGYSIKPVNSDYIFEPTDFSIENLNESQVINFKGIDLRLSRSICGRILDSLNNPIPAILIRLKSGQNSLTTLSNQDGEYRFDNLKSQMDYLVYPDDKLGHYEPDSIQIVFLKENLSDQNFIRILKKSPPQIINIEGQTISEGEQFIPLNLNELVVDPDQKANELHWYFFHHSPLKFEIDTQNICRIQVSHEDWYGRVKVNFVVQDEDGLKDSVEVFFIVKNVNDPPESFHLATDYNIIMDKNYLYHFKWHQAVDPDSGDQVYYYIMIDTSSTNVMRQPMYHFYARTDTSLITALELPQRNYYWTVWAGDLKSPLTRCLDIGRLSVQIITVTEHKPDQKPGAFVLKQNYPNPFNPGTSIEYLVPESSLVTLRIYDTRGNLVTQLVHDTQPAGQYRVFWNGQNQNGNLVASGIYFCEIRSMNFRKIIAMIFLK